jgi:hypothetical protein
MPKLFDPRIAGSVSAFADHTAGKPAGYTGKLTHCLAMSLPQETA